MQDDEILGKKTAAIKTILPTKRSFEGNTKPITPTLINYFFGRNGAGKSTIAKAIEEDDGVIWEDFLLNLGIDLGNFSFDLGNLPADLGNFPFVLGIHLPSLVDLCSQSFEWNRHYNAVFIKPDSILSIRLRDPRHSASCVFRYMELYEHIG